MTIIKKKCNVKKLQEAIGKFEKQLKNGKRVNKDRSLKDKNLDYKLIDVSVSISKQNLITIILNKEYEIKVLRKNIKIPNPEPTQTIEIVVLSKNIKQIDHENISLKKRPSQFVIQVKALKNKNSKNLDHAILRTHTYYSSELIQGLPTLL